MVNQMLDGELARLIRTTLAPHFCHNRIVDVTVAVDEDCVGDQFLLIHVIFQSDPETLDARNIIAALHHCRAKLIEKGELRNADVSFISQADAIANTP